MTIYSVEEADRQFFLTMELVEGRALADAIPKGGLPLDRVLRICSLVVEAIAAAHQKGIMHRDLKPANIMIGEGGAFIRRNLCSTYKRLPSATRNEAEE